MTAQEKTFVELCKEHLSARWGVVSKSLDAKTFDDPLLPEHAKLRQNIVDCLTSGTKSYHYVLPTQVLSKCVNSKIDAHSLQAAYAKPGAFDARTIAHEVIVPFDQANHKVLGGSSEPYVNNPLRCPAIINRFRKQQKNKDDWDKLVGVLDAVQVASHEFAQKIFDQILAEVYRLLSDVQVIYPTPNRINLKQTIVIVRNFTAEKSGGDRIEAICTALFRVIAVTFGLFDEIRRQKVNAADAVSGMGADIECYFKGRVALLVEVKDRALTLIQLDSKLDLARSKKITEILFLAEKGVERTDQISAEQRIESEFASGQNVYVSNFMDFATGLMVLLGEKGRVLFLRFVGEELEKANSAIKHRRAWAQFLKSI